MGNFLMLVISNAKKGKDAEYNDWYNRRHIHDICDIPGVISGKRFEASSVSPQPQPSQYIAIYEIDAENPNLVLEELKRRSRSGMMEMSDALDTETPQIWLYEGIQISGQ